MFDRKKVLSSLISGAHPEAALSNLPDRYEELVARIRALLEMTNEVKRDYDSRMAAFGDNPSKKGEVKASMMDHYNAYWIASDSLLDFVLKAFNGSNLKDPAIYQQVRDLFDEKIKVDVLDENQLRQVEDAIVAIATARYFLRYNQAPWNPDKMKNFGVFAERYRDLILG